MAEVLIEFDAVLRGANGATYVPRACGRVGDGGLWEGWIEFTDVRSGNAVRTPRETTQPERQDLVYWATGLSRVYLEGALARALAPARGPLRASVDVEPAFDGPAPAAGAVPATGARPVLNPFEVYAQGEDILRRELLALDLDHLRTLVRGYGLDIGGAAQSVAPAIVAEAIVGAVRARVPGAGGEVSSEAISAERSRR